MAMTPEKRIELEDRLNKLVPRLLDSPVQVGTIITNILKQYKQDGFHESDLSIRVVQHDLGHDYERLHLLRQKVGHYCEWSLFLQACVCKVDINGLWRPTIIAQVCGEDPIMFNVYENMGHAPYEWLKRVLAMPDIDPNAYTPRSNYADVCEPLEGTLRACGKTAAWIAKTLSDFLANFNGTKVTVADVRHSQRKSNATATGKE